MSPVFALVALYTLVFVLHLIVPGRRVTGYVRDETSGELLGYRLNGVRVMALVVALYVAAGWSGLVAWDYLYVHRWETLATACALGLVFTLAIVLPFPRRRGLLADLYLGRLANPQLLDGFVDAKMFLYLIGAVMLQLNVLSFAAHHVLTHAGDPSPGVFVYVGLFSFFLWEYLNFEEVHLYTYDFVAERVGFKLGWGCLVFYPFFYPIGLWWMAELPNPGTPWIALVGCAALFFAGWMMARGANMQKFWFKTQPEKLAFGVLKPEVLTDGERTILVGGFWGLSRHINYLGEMTMATALALSLGYPGVLGPWLYPLFYVGLLVPRQIDDDRRCREKYGALWAEYERRVPWRIIPRVY